MSNPDAPQSAEGEAVSPTLEYYKAKYGDPANPRRINRQLCPKCDRRTGQVIARNCPIHGDYEVPLRSQKALPSADSRASAEATDAQTTELRHDHTNWPKGCPLCQAELAAAKPEPQQPKTDELDRIFGELWMYAEQADDQFNKELVEGFDEAKKAIRQLIRTERVSELEALLIDPWVEPVSQSKNVAVERIEARISQLKGENQ